MHTSNTWPQSIALPAQDLADWNTPDSLKVATKSCFDQALQGRPVHGPGRTQWHKDQVCEQQASSVDVVSDAKLALGVSAAGAFSPRSPPQILRKVRPAQILRLIVSHAG